MATAGLYRRVLPSPPAIDFASTEGKKLFIEAVQDGTMEGFFKLISYFQTQSEPAYCGLASLSMVLNALAIDPGRTWKGPWRWFDESMLDCCEPLEKVKSKGIPFGKLTCLAQCAGANVQAFRTSESSISEFRNYVKACSISDECHVISSYHRGIFKQTGTGHFSPIGGYHGGRDMALILDVARFKYPPHWVPLSLLWEAMDTVVEASGQRRGYVLISRQQHEPGLLYTLSCKHENRASIAKYLMEDVPLLLKLENVKDIKSAISAVCMSLPSNFRDFIKWVAEVRRHEDDGQSLSQEEMRRHLLKEELLKQVHDTGLYKQVTKFLSSVYMCSRKSAMLGHEHSLSDVAAAVCCEGAELLTGQPGSSGGFCCEKTCVKQIRGDGGKPVTLVSGTVKDGASKQGLQILVPVTQQQSNCCSDPNCSGMHPAGNDVLTVLLLALPMQTWSGIKDEMLVQELTSLVSTEHLPTLLKEEVLHLRRQLILLKQCQDNEVDGQLSVSTV
ncbi:glutathione gamma-glutamylcysteinyltransferase 1-like isoform X2 [Chenopodium quinoa]|uniref:glutathione gamma-glutamylcysteinyltransferase n=2 Tax=Chenopodium quinoa TaxID=63459 RepID=A0A803M9A8_CHEQI|nr:glutathione gamma-glutamylcysteinyltransferase 1-like isoform X2 [Chenopodium quinoa]